MGGPCGLSPELVPCRVGVAHVSVRVTPQSTARTVVLEVLPMLGRQVCARPGPGVAAPCGCPGEVGACWSRPDAPNSAPTG